MAAVMTRYYNATGVQPVALDTSVAGSGGWLLSLVFSSDWAGSLTLYQDRNAPGTMATTPSGTGGPNVPASTASLTQVGWTDMSGNVNPNGGPLNASGTIIVGLPVYPLYASVQWYAGSVTICHTPYVQPDTRGQTANWSQIVIDKIPPEYDETFELVQALEDSGSTAGTLTT